MAAAYIMDDHFMEALSDRAVKCTICNVECKDNNKLASNACLDCKCYLCDPCTEAHKTSDKSADHQIRSLDELSVGKNSHVISQYHQSNFKECMSHFRPLDLFCEDDQVSVCYLCTFERPHKGHNITPLVTKTKEMKTNFNAQQQGLAEIKTMLQSSNAEITTAIKTTQVSKETIIATIESQTQTVIEIITGCADEVKSNIAKECDEHNNYLRRELAVRQNNIQSLSDLSKSVANLAMMDSYQLIETAPAMWKDVKNAYWPEARKGIKHKTFNIHTGKNVNDQFKSLFTQSLGEFSADEMSLFTQSLGEFSADEIQHKTDEEITADDIKAALENFINQYNDSLEKEHQLKLDEKECEITVTGCSKTFLKTYGSDKAQFGEKRDLLFPTKAAKTAAALGTHSRKKEEIPEYCTICLCTPTNPVVLSKCKHTFCKACIDLYFSKTQPKCPNCGVLYGEVKGNQPNGQMDVTRDMSSLSGYPKCGTIVINYNIPGGTQNENHPKPGKPYYGTTRQAFLPDNTEGNKVLALLDRAFKARMIFTVGRSSITGRDDQVIWNCIHHKPQRYGGINGYGDPDPTYLSRVQEELAAQGFK